MQAARRLAGEDVVCRLVDVSFRRAGAQRSMDCPVDGSGHRLCRRFRATGSTVRSRRSRRPPASGRWSFLCPRPKTRARRPCPLPESECWPRGVHNGIPELSSTGPSCKRARLLFLAPTVTVAAVLTATITKWPATVEVGVRLIRFARRRRLARAIKLGFLISRERFARTRLKRPFRCIRRSADRAIELIAPDQLPARTLLGVERCTQRGGR